MPREGPAAWGRKRSRRLAGAGIVLLTILLPGNPLFAGAAARAPLVVIEGKTGPTVRMEPALARAVEQCCGEYRLPTAAEEDPQLRAICHEHHPESRVTYAVLGDFNGDGRIDAALRLRGRRSRHSGLLAAFHATRSGSYQAYVLDRGREAAGALCLTRRRPGAITYVRYRGDEILAAPGRMRLRSDGIELTNPEAGSRLYYWDGARYRHVQTAE
jgi:hypothetical protein